MLKNLRMPKYLLLFIMPYIALYAIYIQLAGDNSPGGGFQSGVIFASSLIARHLITGSIFLPPKYSNMILLIICVSGVLIYFLTGLACLAFGGTYLDYSVLAKNNIHGQHLGIFLIELGVGLTVSSAMCIIYLLLQNPEQKQE
jgi:multicomponent Na+:H+ antiporter subunit B